MSRVNRLFRGEKPSPNAYILIFLSLAFGSWWPCRVGGWPLGIALGSSCLDQVFVCLVALASIALALCNQRFLLRRHLRQKYCWVQALFANNLWRGRYRKNVLLLGRFWAAIFALIGACFSLLLWWKNCPRWGRLLRRNFVGSQGIL